MRIRSVSAASGVVATLLALVLSSGTATAAAKAVDPALVTTPVGVEVVNGIADADNPLDAKGLTKSVGYKSTPARFPGAESVIGVDTRKQILNTTQNPYRAVVKLGGGSLSGCTGWMISADTLMTAGHCVWNGFEYTADFNAWPAKNGNVAPFGSCQASQIWTDKKWLETQDWEYDWALVKLNCRVGEQTGWFGYKVANDAALLKSYVSVTGYPGDMPESTMWTDNKKVANVTPTKVWYPNDTIGGQSGAPVYTSAGQAIAIHAYGDDGTGNSGTRIKAQLFNVMSHLKDR
ncbi:trypsin-like serine peptidase [Psychromicrobium sp. YIM B11713]|uniref:trypsin-like serine peptidase n=1 Tax=Psychromicrobium sp. YIM B11713 TaxID=3145233 RepID=UPI00374F6C07